MKNIFLLMVVSILAFSCEKENSSDNTDNDSTADTVYSSIGPSVSSPYYVKMKINGNWIVLEDSISDYLNLTTPEYNIDDSVAGALSYFAESNYYQTEHTLKPLVLLAFWKNYTNKGFPGASNCYSEPNLIGLGKVVFANYEYVKIVNSIYDNSIQDGVSISYGDDTGKIWKSLEDSFPQTNSYFEVFEYELNSGEGSTHSILAQFSCDLYDSNGNSIHVEEGQIKARVFNCK